VENRALRIGEVARRTGISPDTLRHYERHGLIPKPKRTAGGYRMFSSEVIERVRLIRSALSVGFTIRELSRIFRIRDRGGVPCAEVRSLAVLKLDQLEKRIAEMQGLGVKLRSLIKTWDGMLSNVGSGHQARLLDVLVSKNEGDHT
jgi:MerR family transcriptional regulator, copper efflux regulator